MAAALRAAMAAIGGPRRLALIAATAALLVLATHGLWLQMQAMLPGQLGEDFRFYRSVAERWLSRGDIYAEHQLNGPYEVVVNSSVLYPPVAVLWFLPFVWLPAIAWWVIPLGTLALQFWILRPAPWTWPVLALIVLWPRTIGGILFGNTDMWIAAFVAGGTIAGWPAALVLLKPSLAPFALVAIRDRRLWVALALLGITAIPFGPRWLEYAQAVRDAHALPISYSLLNVPLLLAPMVVWLGRRASKPQDAAGTSRGLTEAAPIS